MPTTAWRFAGTEGADNAVIRLKQLAAQDLINVVDVAVLRWPEYAAEPTTLRARDAGGREGLHDDAQAPARHDRRLDDLHGQG